MKLLGAVEQIQKENCKIWLKSTPLPFKLQDGALAFQNIYTTQYIHLKSTESSSAWWLGVFNIKCCSTKCKPLGGDMLSVFFAVNFIAVSVPIFQWIHQSYLPQMY